MSIDILDTPLMRPPTKATFYRKLKDQDITPANEGNKNCEFSKRKREKGLDYDDIDDNNDDLKNYLEYIKNQCGKLS